MTARPLKPLFELDYHAKLTTQANDGVLKTDQLDIVVLSNLAQDLDQFNSEIHFDNCDFTGGVDHINRLWQAVESNANRFPDVALAAFGALLHTAQDFYAHSNWVELHIDQTSMPVWDQTVDTLPNGIVSGTFLLDWPKRCGPDAPTHAELNKDGPNTTEGLKIVESGPNKGKTLFELAFAVALVATREQYKRLSSLNIGLAQVVAAAGELSFEDLIKHNQRLRAGN